MRLATSYITLNPWVTASSLEYKVQKKSFKVSWSTCFVEDSSAARRREEVRRRIPFAGIEETTPSSAMPIESLATNIYPPSDRLPRPVALKSETRLDSSILSSTSSKVLSTNAYISLCKRCATISSALPSFPKTASDSSRISMYAKESVSGFASSWGAWEAEIAGPVKLIFDEKDCAKGGDGS